VWPLIRLPQPHAAQFSVLSIMLKVKDSSKVFQMKKWPPSVVPQTHDTSSWARAEWGEILFREYFCLFVSEVNDSEPWQDLNTGAYPIPFIPRPANSLQLQLLDQAQNNKVLVLG
jgi:hypothetical protein